MPLNNSSVSEEPIETGEANLTPTVSAILSVASISPNPFPNPPHPSKVKKEIEGNT